MDYLVLTLSKENDQHLHVHIANDFPIHRTKLENADNLYEEHKGKLLAPPSEEFIDKFPPLVRHEFTIKDPKTDIVFSGLGWITVQHGRCDCSCTCTKRSRSFYSSIFDLGGKYFEKMVCSYWGSDFALFISFYA